MSQQPKDETMDTTTSNRDRLIAACDTDADASAFVLRQRLVSAARPRLAEALEKLNVD